MTTTSVWDLMKEQRQHIYRYVLDKVERTGINEILVKSKFILFLEISDFHDMSRQLNPMTT